MAGEAQDVRELVEAIERLIDAKLLRQNPSNASGADAGQAREEVRRSLAALFHQAVPVKRLGGCVISGGSLPSSATGVSAGAP